MSNQEFEFFHPATGCAKCPALAAGRHTVVWGKGPEQARVMLIGEAPGQNEDLAGLPFVGTAGRLLNELLNEVPDLPQVHIGNRIMCRPPGNRDPEPEERDNCEPWLIQHVRDVQPEAIVLFGRSAISWLFDKQTVKDTQGLMYIKMCDSCGGLHGKWITGTPGQCKVTERLVAAIYHPASALGNRSPENKPRIIHQLQRVARELASDPLED